MDLNKECIDIILYLMEKKQFIRVIDLASHYKVTDRTIRYKLNKIDLFFDKKGLKILERNHLKGVRIILNKETEEYISSFINEYTPYQYTFSKEERFQIMLMNLLQSTEPCSINHFEKVLCASRNTVINELENIKVWLEQRNLVLDKKSKSGLIIKGSESIKRKSLAELKTFNFIPQKSLTLKTKNAKTALYELKALFEDVDMEFIDAVIRESEEMLRKQFTDEAYSGLATHLSIMIKRVQMNENIDLCPINLDMKENQEEHKVALYIIEKIENKFNIKINQEELSYIMIHLLGAKVIKYDGLNMEDVKENNLRNIVYAMIEIFKQLYSLTDSDIALVSEMLINGLILHLRPTLYRLKYDLRIINPIIEDIYIKYNELFTNTRIIVKPLEDYVSKNINDHEVAYILMHFGAALRVIEQNRKIIPRVLIVCSSGIGTAKIIAAQLEEMFQINVVDTISSRNLSFYDEDSYDFIITTVNIEKSSLKKSIKISPLFVQSDYAALNEVLKPKYNLSKNKQEYNMVNNILAIVKKYCVIENEQQLQCELMMEVNKEKNTNVTGGKPSLASLIKGSTIKVKEICNNWEEAVSIGVDILRANNAVTDKYKEAIINNFKKYGPYMVIAPGVVLSHADINCGVNKIAMSLVTLKYPIKFGSENYDPVKLIITFSTTDREIHLKALSQLTDIVSSEKTVREIIKADTKAEIIKLISLV